MPRPRDHSISSTISTGLSKGSVNPTALNKECKWFGAGAARINCAGLYKSRRNTALPLRRRKPYTTAKMIHGREAALITLRRVEQVPAPYLNRARAAAAGILSAPSSSSSRRGVTRPARIAGTMGTAGAGSVEAQMKVSFQPAAASRDSRERPIISR